MNKRNVTIAVVALAVIAIGLFWQSSQNREGASEQSTTTNSQMLGSDSDIRVKTSEAEYASGIRGYYAEPEEAGDYPGVIMIHEWWGLNQNIKDMAVQLSKEGYKVLAVDLFKGSVATTTQQAMAQTGNLNQEEALNNLKAAKSYLKAQNANKIASLGWCFGGGQSMQLSVSGEPLDATVVYYGNLVTDRVRLENIRWPVLGIFGDQDTSIPVSTVSEFDSTLDSLNIENDIRIYPGVGHAFANPSGQNYAPEATQDAWSRTLAFLNRNLKG